MLRKANWNTEFDPCQLYNDLPSMGKNGDQLSPVIIELFQAS